MRTSARIQAIGALIALATCLISCSGGGDEVTAPPVTPPPPQDTESTALFAQEKVLRNDRSQVASMPSSPGASYAWKVVEGSASATILDGESSNVIRFASGENVGTFKLSATVTASDGSTTTATRTVYVVQEWLLDSTKPLQRQEHSATLLNDGRVLVAGGAMGYGSGAPNPSVQIYDPETNTWGSAKPILTPRTDYTATRLADGNVLLAGGMAGDGDITPSAAAEIYDAATGSWRKVAPLSHARYHHTATLLADGRVLVAGGADRRGQGGGGSLTSAEIYDPATDQWSDAGSLSTARELDTAVRLQNGKVLVAGGYGQDQHALSSAELYDAGTNTWSKTGNLAIARTAHAAELLNDGRVVVVGGADDGGSDLVEAEAYNPATGTWSGAGSLTTARWHFALSLLPDGRLLATGGTYDAPVNVAVETYDPGTNTWYSVESMADGRVFHTSTTLNNGKVLVVGGADRDAPLASAELYNPADDHWSSAGHGGRLAVWGHTSTLLQDGTLLQAGGQLGTFGAIVPRSTRYDPVAGTWEEVGSLAEARLGHSATLLATGEVLVAGGQPTEVACDPCLQTTELYDPATRQWHAAAPMGTRRGQHTATALPDGRVLVAGGGETYYHPLASAELYDRGSDTWVPAGIMATPRDNHTATLLLDGKVLVAGGESTQTLALAELYDPATNTWQATGAMGTARWGHTATRLPDGKVLVAGGYSLVGNLLKPVPDAEIYDPATGMWASASAMSFGRVHHTATLLPDGRVMVTGGQSGDFMDPPVAATEIYDPATGAWHAEGELNFPRMWHTATLLDDGRVVVLGGGYAFHVTGGVEFWK